VLTDEILNTCGELKRRGLAVSEIKGQPYGREATFNEPDDKRWVHQQPLIGMRS
jgi:hypothetical protein